ncbi:MAG: DUF2164 domain-containing protein [Veillonellaceae bacterium]|jgi:uncharacterized protein (DUF2164 family)|nr:DUF2164 domain-containing protein [Veillonellaceae bacterium]
METIKLSPENKEDLIRSIKEFFLKERDEEISDFKASVFLDFIINEAGIFIYNQAISDAHHFMNEKAEELFSLEKKLLKSKSRR